MTSNRHDKAGLFEAAAEIADPQVRAAFLEDACGDDRALRQEIEALLRHDGAAGSFLEQPVLALNPDATREYQPVTEGPGTRIGSGVQSSSQQCVPYFSKSSLAKNPRAVFAGAPLVRSAR